MITPYLARVGSAVEWSQCAIAFGASTRRSISASESQVPRVDETAGNHIRVADSVFLHSHPSVCPRGQSAHLHDDRGGTTGASLLWQPTRAGEDIFRRAPGLRTGHFFRITPGTTRHCGRLVPMTLHISAVRLRPATCESKCADSRKVRRRILFHMEFMKNGSGKMIPGAIPVVRFQAESD